MKICDRCEKEYVPCSDRQTNFNYCSEKCKVVLYKRKKKCG